MHREQAAPTPPALRRALIERLLLPVRRVQSFRSRLQIVLNPDARVAYSQEGEDLILLRYFEVRPEGFYVDVGAHHPSRFSNTRLLYERGWRGINVDALPGSMSSFLRERPRDVNLEIGVGRSAGQGRFFRFQEPALSTFDEVLAAERVAVGWALAEEHVIQTRTLTDILEGFGSPAIDFLNIDVEGRDLDVLRGLDLQRFRPEVICVESLPGTCEVSELLAGHSYEVWARTLNSVFFVDRQSKAAELPAPTASDLDT